MKKQDLAKLAILGIMGVAATVGAQQQTQPKPVNGQQPATQKWEASCAGGPVNSGYSSSDKSNTTGNPSTTQVPVGSGQGQAQGNVPSTPSYSCTGNNAPSTPSYSCTGGNGNNAPSTPSYSCTGNNAPSTPPSHGCNGNNGNSQQTRVNRYR
ncbi:MAG: hypothetical protein P4L16_05210 [Chlamydiales bacterium]|nr:hypothetical protein [Chlamydiales bacterium]